MSFVGRGKGVHGRSSLRRVGLHEIHGTVRCMAPLQNNMMRRTWSQSFSLAVCQAQTELVSQTNALATGVPVLVVFAPRQSRDSNDWSRFVLMSHETP